MTLAIVLSLLLAATCVVIAVLLLFQGAERLLAEAVGVTAGVPLAPSRSHAAPAADSKPPAVPASSAPSPPSQTRIRLVSNSGRHLGDTTVPAKGRRATFAYRIGKSKDLSVFVSSHKLPDGEWEYRRVGVERAE